MSMIVNIGNVSHVVARLFEVVFVKVVAAAPPSPLVSSSTIQMLSHPLPQPAPT